MNNIELKENETIEDYVCPYCGSKLITRDSCGISQTFCTNLECDYDSFDYDL